MNWILWWYEWIESDENVGTRWALITLLFEIGNYEYQADWLLWIWIMDCILRRYMIMHRLIIRDTVNTWEYYVNWNTCIITLWYCQYRIVSERPTIHDIFFIYIWYECWVFHHTAWLGYWFTNYGSVWLNQQMWRIST